jgi:hypothetical protein
MTPEINKYNSIIFLDIDGCLNSQLFYEERYNHLIQQDNDVPLYKIVKKHMKKQVKSKVIEKLDYYKGEMCGIRIGWLNELCTETNSAIVLSASMRAAYSVEQLQEIFNYCGATFTIIGKTGHSECRHRGCEIKDWLKSNSSAWFGVNYYDFYKFIIIDDDNDFLLEQADHFFQCDGYCGITPAIIYRIKNYLLHKTF